jgi:hypothetical protein
MKSEPDHPMNTKLLQVICQLHDWENQHLHLVQSQAGRYLYLSLVKQLTEAKQDQPSALLKGIYHNQDLSERALRYKIREFEQEGLIKFECNQFDKRSKKILAHRGFDANAGNTQPRARSHLGHQICVVAQEQIGHDR